MPRRPTPRCACNCKHEFGIQHARTCHPYSRMAVQARLSHPSHNAMDGPSTFLFLPCDGNARPLRGTRRDINRHVQYSYRNKGLPQTSVEAPLPRLIKFRAGTRRARDPLGHTLCTKRGTAQRWAPLPDPRRLTIPICVWANASEVYLYDYYANVVTGHLFCDKISTFWEVFVMQTCHHLAVVRESLLALSSAFSEAQAASHQVHLPWRITEGTMAASCKAVGMLRAYMQHEACPSHAIVLTCAIILYAQAKVLGDHDAAAGHLNKAINIFDTWTVNLSGNTEPSDYTVIRNVILTLDINASVEHETRMPMLRLPGLLPSRFDSLESMLYGSCVVIHSMMCFTMANYKHILAGRSHSPPSVISAKDALVEDLEKWKFAADAFASERNSAGSSFTPREEECYHSIMLHYFTGKCQLARVLPVEECVHSEWDQCSTQVIECGERILRLRMDANQHGRNTGKRRSLIVTYAQSLRLLAAATTSDGARARTLKLIAQAEDYEQLILPVDMSHISSDKGLEHALHALEEKSAA